MSNTYFKFKQFRINQERCAMKVGTDGVLLGSWASMDDGDNRVGAAAATWSPGPLRQVSQDLALQSVDRDLPPLKILDIGTGTGLLALMLAQRAASRTWGRRAFSVTAVEREAAAAAQARENVAASPWASAVTVVTADIRSWQPAVASEAPAAAEASNPVPAVLPAASIRTAPHFDLIVCNPPFYTDSLKGPDAARNAARHDDGLKTDDLFRLAAAWLKPAPATFNLIFPADKEVLAVETAFRHGLRPVRLCRVFTALSATRPSRVLLAFGRADGTTPPSVTLGSPLTENLWIYSEAFRALVQPFYLNM